MQTAVCFKCFVQWKTSPLKLYLPHCGPLPSKSSYWKTWAKWVCRIRTEVLPWSTSMVQLYITISRFWNHLADNTKLFVSEPQSLPYYYITIHYYTTHLYMLTITINTDLLIYLLVPSENVATEDMSAFVIEGVSRTRNSLINGDVKNYDWDSGYTCHQLGKL